MLSKIRHSLSFFISTVIRMKKHSVEKIGITVQERKET